MKVLVVTGSPKGKNSITYQTVLFIQSRFSDVQFDVIHAGQAIKKIEKDFSPAIEQIKSADLVLFCYPVYTFVVPSQLHRFIELMKDSGEDFSSKYAAQICTSKHFYDTTACTFITDNLADMKMKYLGALSADMEDLLCERGQKEAIDFWNLVMFRMENGLPPSFIACQHQSEPVKIPDYKKTFSPVQKSAEKKVVIVADLKPGDKNLQNMIDDFRDIFPYETKLVNIEEFPFDGGCLGCFNCSVMGTCIWKDRFDDFLRNEIQTNDSIVYAFTIKNHSMGSRFKMYDDRQFCNGHRTVTAGKPFGYIVNGDLKNEPNLRVIIEGRAEVGRNFLAGVATNADEISALSKTLAYSLEKKLLFPANYWGEGGARIFRDLIYVMQGFMSADHKFYKKNGLYDTLPTKQKKTIWKMRLVGLLMKNKKIKSKAASMMDKAIVGPYLKVINGDKK